MIRLKPKSEIERIKSFERKKEIEEGIKLAKRVDGLRELVQEEDRKFREHRDKTVSEVQKEIDGKLKELSSVESELEKKKKEIAKYFEKNPIDKQWLIFVKTEKENIENQTSMLQSEWALLLKSKEQVKEDKRLLEERENKVEIEERELSSTRALTEKMRFDSQKEIEIAKKTLEEINNESDSLLAASRKVHAKAEQKELELEHREKQLDKREEKLDEREMNVVAKELLYYSPVKKR